jgi:threonyl-tRNA synthetase
MNDRHDHRKLGRELGIFGTDPLIGAGLPYWLPDGAVIRHELEEYIRSAERIAGYQHVCSPVLGKRELYEISGHWAHYAADMYPPMTLPSMTGDGEQLVLRPSLCPHHAVIYRSREHSYRELPLRMAEFGGQFRSELSGVLGGLNRVRAMSLNDAHIFCTADQVRAEAASVLAMIQAAYAVLGVSAARYRLSLPADEDSAGGGGVGGGGGGKYVADPELWARATALLTEVLDEAGIRYEKAPGEAAFYGPKIDVQVTDAAGRESTLSTLQIDFWQPARFGLAYVGADGARHRPVMIHRSVIGSVERAVAHLLDANGGAFAPWLAPLQVAVLPVSDASSVVSAAAEFERSCAAAGLRARVISEGTLGARIRDQRLVPYVAVIGEREAESGSVALRLRAGQQAGALAAGAALDRVSGVVAGRGSEL